MEESNMNSPTSPAARKKGDEELKAATKEEELVSALGITMMEPESTGLKTPHTKPYSEHKIVPDPTADQVDLSELRGTKAPTKGREEMLIMKNDAENDELEALAELVPELKSKATKERENHTMTVDQSDSVEIVPAPKQEADEGPIEVKVDLDTKKAAVEESSVEDEDAKKAPVPLTKTDSLQVHESLDVEDLKPPALEAAAVVTAVAQVESDDEGEGTNKGDDDHDLVGFGDADSDNALNSDAGDPPGDTKTVDPYPNISSALSLSTATQTHEVRMPMYLPTFKPATGCTNASDFIVRCFVARLRSGITVVKHGRSRWCKSRLRILHIHPDGRSLSWKPAVGEPTSSKRPPKLDLSTCEEVRHAWSPDPLNPMFTGTPILRQKCEAANAHKSFALIFPKRTVDITAVTADQCKVLMEGFSALCFRLQVANLAGRGARKRTEEEEGTASVTLTNNSTIQHSPAIGGKRK